MIAALALATIVVLVAIAVITCVDVARDQKTGRL